MKLFLSPHCDDETLFGAFIIQGERPHVAIVLDGCVQATRGRKISWYQRRMETMAAMNELQVDPPEFLGFSDLVPPWPAIKETLRKRYDPEIVWAPLVEVGGHAQHNAVGEIARELWPGRVVSYATYTNGGKSSVGERVEMKPEWVERKLRALACYHSQILEWTTQPHFLREQYEYVERR